MKLRDLTELAGRNLREAVLRNSLTTLGIGVGVASLVAILSLGVGLQQLANKRLTNSGLFNAVIVMSRQNFRGGFGRGRGEQTDSSTPPRPLDENARKELAQIPGVVEVYPEVRFPTGIKFNNNTYPTVVAGVPQSSKGGGAYDGIQGSFFSGPDAQEAILQIELAKQLSNNPNSLIGQDVTLNYAERQALAPSAGGGISGGFSVVPHEEKLKIVGIIDTEPTTGAGGFGQVRLIIPLDVAEKLQAAQTNDLRSVLGGNGGRSNYASLTVRVDDPAQVEVIEDNIKARGFGAFSLLDASKNLTLIFGVFDTLFGSFGGLALVVASLGIVNTLVMAILERRREIGILKALGASDGDVKKLFFTEAGCMGLLGGVIGVVLGWAIGRGINFGANVYLHRQNLPSIQLTAVPIWMVLFAIAISIGVSLAAGLYPASRAAKLNPVEALRYE
ncbi:MAG TPA: FtsX-like permease family protein [Candidatus Acidoferrales bacterium]|nr:FtsX-like permease family protein [Candidatus Acidoferrales bacterium]